MSYQSQDSFNELAPFIQDYIFRQRWEALRPVQVSAIQAILHTPDHILISSPTASGKTEAAMLPILTALDQKPSTSIGVMYIGPLKALINDQFERLQAILEETHIPVQSWHGDVAQSKKERFLQEAQGILQITPESLEALLINRHTELKRLLGDLRFVVIDEVHAFIGSDRGRQILCQLQRLERYQSAPPRRIGLSATIGEPQLALDWLGGGAPRPVTLISDSGAQRDLALGLEHFVSMPTDGMPEGTSEGTSEGATEEETDGANDEVNDSALYEHIYAMCRQSTKTLIFANQRAAVEKIVANLRALAAANHTPDIYHVHHGSISKELREAAENAMRDPSQPATVAATLTLELGIDIGRLDQVLQLDATNTVSSFVQRLGRSGRRGTPSQMFFYCQERVQPENSVLAGKIPWNLLQSIAIIQLYLEEKWVEPPDIPQYPLSLLYQQTLSILAATTELSPPHLAEQVLTMAPFRGLSQDDYRTFLRQLLATQHLQQTETGTLIVGLAGEKLTNHYQFYATFDDQMGYRVIAGAQEIGAIGSAPEVGESFQLAGFTWRALTVDLEAKAVHVEHTAGSGKTTWLGGAFSIHPRILQRMRQLLQEESDFAYLHKQARQRLQTARQLAHATAIVEQAIVEEGDGTYLLLPWQGSKLMQTLALLVEQAGLEVAKDGLPYYLRIHRVESQAALQRQLAQIVATPPPADALISHLTPAQLVRAKYDRYAPEALLRQAYIHDALDYEGALEVLPRNDEMSREKLKPMNQVATSTLALPIKDVNSPTVSELSLQESRQHFRSVLHSSLARSLIALWWSRVGRVLAGLSGRKEHFPFVVLVLCLNAFTLLFSISVSLLFGQTAILQPAQLWPLIVWDFYDLLYILVMHSQRTHALHILDTTITDSIASPHDFSHLERMIQRVPRFSWQFSFSLLFALVAGIWIPYVQAVTNGATFLIGQLLLYTINYFQMGMYAYFQFGLILILLGLSRFDLDIYANDPSNAMVIRRVYQATNTLTLAVAALSALHYLLISLLGVDISAPVSIVTLIVLGWLPPLALFITTHVALGRIMTRVKGKKLAQIQGMIQQTERGSDLSSPEAMETIKQLMDYHDRIKITPNSMVNFGSLTNLLGSLLLPLIAMVLANLNTIIGLFS